MRGVKPSWLSISRLGRPSSSVMSQSMTAGRLLMTAMCMAVLPKLSAALTKCQTSPLDSRFKLLLLCQTALSLNSLCEFRLAKDLLLNMARCGVCSWLCSCSLL